MHMKLKDNPWIFAVIVALAMLTRLIPHYPNFTALGAAALFGGAYFRKPIALAIPIVAMFLSDLVLNNLIYRPQFLGNYDGFVVFEPVVLWSYAAFIIIALIGHAWIRSRKILPVIGASLGASVVFFLISNFAVWIHSALYPKTLAGLAAAYGAGLPFFGNTVVGDLFFVAIFFGGLEAVRVFAPRFVHQKG